MLHEYNLSVTLPHDVDVKSKFFIHFDDMLDNPVVVAISRSLTLKTHYFFPRLLLAVVSRW